MRQPGEPTVEEILESIKQVMARDDRALLAGEPARAPASADEAPDDPGPAGEARDTEVLDLARMRQVPPAPTQPAPAAAAPLVTDAASSSIHGSLDALAALSASPRTPPSPGRSEDTSVDSLVRELLRPALAAWLDRNLPPLVERMVAAEIARIVGGRG